MDTRFLVILQDARGVSCAREGGWIQPAEVAEFAQRGWPDNSSAPGRITPAYARREVGEQGIKDFLFRFRNQYTHQADVRPGLTIPPPPESMAGIPPGSTMLSFYDQWHEKDQMVTVMFHDLPDTLFQCVRAGLVARLRGGLE